MTECIVCVFFHIEEDNINEWWTYCSLKHKVWGFESAVDVCKDYRER